MPIHRVIRVSVPDAVNTTVIDPADLPDGWRQTPPPPVLQSIGKTWLDAGETAILEVPSAIVPQESNYVLNPLHADFKRLSIGKADPFALDMRLLDRE